MATRSPGRLILQTALEIVDRDGEDELVDAPSQRGGEPRYPRCSTATYPTRPPCSTASPNSSSPSSRWIPQAGLVRSAAHCRPQLPANRTRTPQRRAVAGDPPLGHPPWTTTARNPPAPRGRPHPAHRRRILRRGRPARPTGCYSPTCTATSSMNCRKSSNDPKKQTTFCGSVCTDCRSPNSPPPRPGSGPRLLRRRRRTRPRPRPAPRRARRNPHPPRRNAPNHLSDAPRTTVRSWAGPASCSSTRRPEEPPAPVFPLNLRRTPKRHQRLDEQIRRTATLFSGDRCTTKPRPHGRRLTVLLTTGPVGARA